MYLPGKDINGIVFLFFLFATVVAGTNSSKAQGCSDAGFCTIGSFKHEAGRASVQKDSGIKHRISFLAPFGMGDENVMVLTPALQYDYSLSDEFALQGRITANYANGNLGSTLGLGDIFLTGSYKPAHRSSWYVQTNVGVKIPLSSGNIKEDDRSLPMQYQSSLGTFDIIAGITVSNDDWQFSTALQQPFSGTNRNNFLPVYWDDPEAKNYPPTNDFRRKGDALLRIGKGFNIKKKVSVNTGLLGIFHLGKDEYTDANVSFEPIPIDGSEGLTLNITAAVWWQVNRKLRVGITGGAPVIAREVRPDGLTRSFVVAPEISWNL